MKRLADEALARDDILKSVDTVKMADAKREIRMIKIRQKVSG
jgi:hypothetical protein